MSNEPQSPPLRLKPRLSSGQPVPTPENPPATPTAPAAPASAPTGLRISPLPTPEAPPPLRAVIPAPLPPEPVPAPISSTPAPPPPSEEPGRFKLKPRSAAPVAPQPAALANPAAADSLPAEISAPGEPVPVAVSIVKPTLPAAALASPAFAKPAGPPNSGRPNMPIAPLPASAPSPMPPGGVRAASSAIKPKEPEVKAGKFAVKLLMALLFVAIALFGVFAYNLWFAQDPAPAPVSSKPAPAPAAVETQPSASIAAAPDATAPADVATPPSAPPAVVVENPQSAQGQQVAKAQAAAAAHDTALSQPVDDLLATPAASPSSGAVATPAIVPGALQPQPTTTPVQAEVPAAAVAAPLPEPSAAFQSLVEDLKISGVFQGANARAMLNGKMYRLGETIDPKLGVVFLRLEPATKHIVFKDAKGAIVSRRY